MEILVLNGKTYVKASRAARDLGYTSDYVGQLCRGGHVDAHLVGRSWYVNMEELGTHRVEKKRLSRVKAREQAKRMLEERRREESNKTKNSYTNIKIRYETDPSDLIPPIEKERKLKFQTEGEKMQERLPVSGRRLRVHAEGGARFTTNIDLDEKEPYIIQNEGKKILMSGKLKVVDVSDDLGDPSVTLLMPKIVKHRPETTEAKTEKLSLGGRKVVVTEDYEMKDQRLKTENINKKKDFFDRLSEQEIEYTTPEPITAKEHPQHNVATSVTEIEIKPIAKAAEGSSTLKSQSEATITPQNQTKSSGFQYMLTSTLITALCIAIGSLLIEGQWHFEQGSGDSEVITTTTYTVDPLGTYEKLQKLKD
jgi:hypothetical protein